MIAWTYDDGGRAAAGYRGRAGDCVVRSIAIATARSYEVVYDDLGAAIGEWAASSRSKAARHWRSKGKGATPRDGVPMPVIRPYLQSFGWLWTPTMQIGSGTTVHLRADELPAGRLIVRCSGHLTAVIDGVVHDTHDPSRDGSRAVYGYWARPS